MKIESPRLESSATPFSTAVIRFWRALCRFLIKEMSNLSEYATSRSLKIAATLGVRSLNQKFCLSFRRECNRHRDFIGGFDRKLKTNVYVPIGRERSD
jgi:hypothetical protein